MHEVFLRTPGPSCSKGVIQNRNIIGLWHTVNLIEFCEVGGVKLGGGGWLRVMIR